MITIEDEYKLLLKISRSLERIANAIDDNGVLKMRVVQINKVHPIERKPTRDPGTDRR
jgi:hypothetical protein